MSYHLRLYSFKGSSNFLLKYAVPMCSIHTPTTPGAEGQKVGAIVNESPSDDRLGLGLRVPLRGLGFRV